MIQLCTEQFCIEIDDTDKSWCECLLRPEEILTYPGKTLCILCVH